MPNAAMLGELQRALEAELKALGPGAAIFEYANLDPAGGGDFVLLASPGPLAISKVAMRMNHAQALAFCSQVTGTIAQMIVRQGVARSQGKE